MKQGSSDLRQLMFPSPGEQATRVTLATSQTRVVLLGCGSDRGPWYLLLTCRSMFSAGFAQGSIEGASTRSKAIPTRAKVQKRNVKLNRRAGLKI